MASIDPDIALRIARATADIYGDAAAQLLQLVARRLAQGIDTPGWAEAKLAEIVPLRDEARKILDRLAVLGPDAIRAAIVEAAEIGAGRPTIEGTLNPVTNTRAVELLAEQTVAQIDGLRPAILRSTLDLYRTVIAETSAPGVITGTMTTRQAAQRALDRFAGHGITGFIDRAGRRWELEAYVEMATRTAAGHAMIDARTDQYRQDGRSLVICSNAPQECSVCRPYEGQLLSLDGENVGATIDGIKVVDTLTGARSRGLFHPNCRHNVRPFIPGLTQPFTNTEDPDGDRARQEQRRLERGVRQWKRRAAVALDDDTRRLAEARAREWQARLRDHVRVNGLKRQPGRERLGAR